MKHCLDFEVVFSPHNSHIMCKLYFLSLEHCALTLSTVFSHCALVWHCYLPALSDTMTVLSCPFLLQIRYQKPPKEANSSTKHSRACIYYICRAPPSPRTLQLRGPPLHFKTHFGAAVLSFSRDLDWIRSAADGKLAGGHTGGGAVTGVIDWGDSWKQQGGKGSQQEGAWWVCESDYWLATMLGFSW